MSALPHHTRLQSLAAGNVESLLCTNGNTTQPQKSEAALIRDLSEIVSNSRDLLILSE